MRNLLTSAVIVFCIGAASGPALAEGAGIITVTGEGMVSAAPDMASVSLGVTTLAETAADAMSQNNAAMQAVMDRLAAAGIEPRDLQTSNLQLQPNWVQEDPMKTPEIRGYTASNMLTARVRDLAILGGVVDAAVKDGANTLNGLSFEQANPKPAQSQARQSAIKDATAKATELVTAAGASLGKILSISENGGYVSPMPMLKAAMDEASVPIAGGEIGISAQVTVVFEIVQ
jgi:uncharacterized protein YggE